MQRKRGSKRSKLDVSSPTSNAESPSSASTPRGVVGQVGFGLSTPTTPKEKEIFIPPKTTTSVREIFEGDAQFGKNTTDKIQAVNGTHVKNVYSQRMTGGDIIMEDDVHRLIKSRVYPTKAYTPGAPRNVDEAIEAILGALEEDLDDLDHLMEKRLPNSTPPIKNNHTEEKLKKTELVDVFYQHEKFERQDDVFTDSEEEDPALRRNERYPPHVRIMRKAYRRAKILNRDRVVNNQSIEVYGKTNDLDKVAKANSKLLKGRSHNIKKREDLRQWARAAALARSIRCVRNWELLGTPTTETHSEIEKHVASRCSVPTNKSVRSLYKSFADEFPSCNVSAPLTEALTKGEAATRPPIFQDSFRWFHARPSFCDVSSGSDGSITIHNCDDPVYLCFIRQSWGKPGGLHSNQMLFSNDFNPWIRSLINNGAPPRFHPLKQVPIPRTKACDRHCPENLIVDENCGFVRLGGGVGVLKSNWSRASLSNVMKDFLEERGPPKTLDEENDKADIVDGPVGIYASGNDVAGIEYAIWGVDRRVRGESKQKEYMVYFDGEDDCTIYPCITHDMFIEKTSQELKINMMKKHVPFFMNGGPEVMRRVRELKMDTSFNCGGYISDADIEVIRKPQDLMVEGACHRHISFLRPRILSYVAVGDVKGEVESDIPYEIETMLKDIGSNNRLDWIWGPGTDESVLSPLNRKATDNLIDKRSIMSKGMEYYMKKMSRLPKELFFKHSDQYNELRELIANQGTLERSDDPIRAAAMAARAAERQAQQKRGR